MELHAVFAVTIQNSAGERGYYRIGRPCDWTTAQDRWNRLDRSRYYNRRILMIEGERRPVAYFAVRSVEDTDTRWSRAIPVPVKACAPKADRPHTITPLAVRQRRVTPVWSALLVSDRGVLRRHGHSPMAATAAVRAEARAGGLI